MGRNIWFQGTRFCSFFGHSFLHTIHAVQCSRAPFSHSWRLSSSSSLYSVNLQIAQNQKKFNFLCNQTQWVRPRVQRLSLALTLTLTTSAEAILPRTRLMAAALWKSWKRSDFSRSKLMRRRIRARGTPWRILRLCFWTPPPILLRTWGPSLLTFIVFGFWFVIMPIVWIWSLINI